MQRGPGFCFKTFPRTKPRRASRVGAGPAPGAAGPADSSWSVEAAVVFVRLAAHAARCLCVRVKPGAHGRAPWASAGRNEPSSPQLANSKQITVSLVPAPLVHGALGGIGAIGENELGPGLDSPSREWSRPQRPVAVRSGPRAGEVRPPPFSLPAPHQVEVRVALLSGLVTG